MNVITLGTFDILHAGHVALFRRCRIYAGDGLVIAGVNSDGFVESYRGKPPAIAEEHRLAVVEALAHVDRALPNQSAGRELIEQVDEETGLHMIVIGSDWHGDDHIQHGKRYLQQLDLDWDWLRGRDIAVAYAPYTAGISSRDIKARLS